MNIFNNQFILEIDKSFSLVEKELLRRLMEKSFKIKIQTNSILLLRPRTYETVPKKVFWKCYSLANFLELDLVNYKPLYLVSRLQLKDFLELYSLFNLDFLGYVSNLLEENKLTQLKTYREGFNLLRHSTSYTNLK